MSKIGFFSLNAKLLFMNMNDKVVNGDIVLPQGDVLSAVCQC